MSKRSVVASVLGATRATDLLLGWQQLVRATHLPVLTYHRIGEPVRDYAFDTGVIDATPDELDRQLAFLCRNFDPIGLEDLLGFLDGRPLPRRPAMVTFDDGYRDNVTVALPILRHHDVRATFFVATDYTSSRRLFWWDRIRYILHTAPRKRVRIAYPQPMLLDLAGASDRDLVAGRLITLVKQRFGLDLPRFLDELAAAAGVAWDAATERMLADALLMTWDDVRALRDAGMAIGSHTRTHRVLQTLRPSELDDELRGSRLELERELGGPVRAISYPVGGDIARSPAIRAALRDAGYAIGFTNKTGAQRLGRAIDPFAVRRIACDLHMPPALFKAMLAMPEVFRA